MRQKATPKRKPAKKVRKYDNTARSIKAHENEQRIIVALVELLAQRQGRDVEVKDIAQKTGLTQRTIFRFFKDKQTLHQAMDSYLLSYLQLSHEQIHSMNFVGFGKNAYKLFDRHQNLTLAYILSPFGQEARLRFRKKLNQSMIDKIRQETKITLTPKTSRRLAIMTSLVNAKIWHDIKTEYGYTGEEMADSVEWALKTLLESIRHD